MTAFPKAVLLAVLITCVCIAVIAVHWPALSAQALSFDDVQYLVNNNLVKNPGWSSAWKFLSQVLEPTTVNGYYQPLTMISLMFDYAIGGREGNLLPFHRTSLAIHAANTALIIVLLYLLFGNVWIAAAVGLLFGVHPMTVETIPWVGERKTLLAGFFALWSLLFYIRYANARDARNVAIANAEDGIRPPARRSARGLYIACFVFFLLALMSKPTSTPLPLLMLLLDFWPLKRLKWQSLVEKIPLFVLGGIFAVITYISQTRTVGSVQPTEAGIWRIPLILCHNIIFYLYKIIWPVNLSSNYPFPDPMNLSQPMVLAGVIGTCILIPVLLISLFWTRAALTGWLFFFVAILPAMQIIGFSNVIASDKFAYLPSFGLLMILTSLLCYFYKKMFTPRLKSVFTAVVILLVLISASAESLAARSYLTHWRNTIGLFEYMFSKAPNAASSYNNLGVAYQKYGRYQSAMECYKQAIKIKPDFFKAYYNLGVLCGELGLVQEEIESYKQAIKARPDYADAHCNLGNAYNKLGRLQEAMDEYNLAIKARPKYADAHYNLGVTYYQLGRYEDAIKEYKQAVKIKPDYAEAYYNLGVAYSSVGNPQEAIESYIQAVRIDPEYAEAYVNLGNAYLKLNRYQDALENYKHAIRIKPDLANAHYALGVTYSVMGNKEAALEEYQILKTLDAEKADKLYQLIYK
jgi:tetratricopeptide (TPR) repeat protein